MPPTTTTVWLPTHVLQARKETPSCGDREKCPMPVGSQALPIGLGIGIPIVGAIILFAFLHWRHHKKMKKEAEEDRDFDMGSVYEDQGKGYTISETRAAMSSSEKGTEGDRHAPPSRNPHQDFNQNDPFFDSPYIVNGGDNYSDINSRSLTNLAVPYAGMQPPTSSGFLSSIGDNRYPSSPVSSGFPHSRLASSSASLASTELRRPDATYQRELPNSSREALVKQPPPLPSMNVARPALSNPGSPADTHFPHSELSNPSHLRHHQQFSIGSVTDSDLDTPTRPQTSDDPFERESNIVHSPMLGADDSISQLSSRGNMRLDSRDDRLDLDDTMGRRREEQPTNTQGESQQSSFQSNDSFTRRSDHSAVTTPEDSHGAFYFDDKAHMEHAPTVPIPPVPEDSLSPPTQFDRVRSVYKVYFDENKRGDAHTVDNTVNTTMDTEKDLPDVPGNTTSDSFPADLTIDPADNSQLRNSQNASFYDMAPRASWENATGSARPTNNNTNNSHHHPQLSSNNPIDYNAPVNALKIDFAPTTPDPASGSFPQQHASPMGHSPALSHTYSPSWESQDMNGFQGQGHQGYHHGTAPPEAYYPQQHYGGGPQGPQGARRKPPPLQLKPLSTVPTPHKLELSDSGVTSFRPSRRVQTPTGSTPGSPIMAQGPGILDSMGDTEAMPLPHALRKSVSLASLDFAPPQRFGANNSRNNSLTSVVTAGGTPIPKQRPTYVKSKLDTALMLKPSWDMRG